MSHEQTSRALARLVRDATPGDVTDDVHDAGRARMVAALNATRRAGSIRWYAVAAAAAAAIALVFFIRSRPPELSYRVEGAASGRGYVQVAASSPRAIVSFSDGTRVEVEPSSRARVAEVSSRGARVVLEDGVLDVDVVHKDGARWTFQAGPYSVNVTGTSFTLRWSAADDRLDVEMKRGSVVVEGPLAAAGVAVVGGQTLDARLRDHTLSVTDADASGAVAPHDETAAVDTSSVERSPMPVSSATEVHALNPLPTRTWSADIAAGDYARIVSEAEEGGLDGVLERRPLADLTALADAARYVRRQDVARRALEAQRSRFPTSKEANAAAFLLGRMAEEAGDSSGALGDYDAYLAASVDGPFAAEALGRKLALLHAQGRAEARPAAEEYLRRFPTGAYARVAHDVVTP